MKEEGNPGQSQGVVQYPLGNHAHVSTAHFLKMGWERVGELGQYLVGYLDGLLCEWNNQSHAASKLL